MELNGAQIRNISELCSRMSNKAKVPLKICIPIYQRPYRWGRDEIDRLVQDFKDNKLSGVNDEYFVGSVVLVGKDQEGVRYDVIDGQQRLTTVFLFNYLRFLIQRSRVEEMISTKKPNIDTPLNDLLMFYRNFIGFKHVESIENTNKDILLKMEELEPLSPEEREKEYEKLTTDFLSTYKLPLRDFGDINAYNNKYVLLQKKFLKEDELALIYSRKSCNETLMSALSKVYVC